jgi:integrase
MARYKRIQEYRQTGQWDVETFHDLWRTCLSNWIVQGLGLHEVKELAGHAGIETTERFYLAVRKDALDRARAASEASRKGQSVARLLRAPSESNEDPITLPVNDLQRKL